MNRKVQDASLFGISGEAPHPMTLPSLASRKKSIRALLRAKRRAITPAVRRLAARQLAVRACRIAAVRRARRIGLYLPMADELDVLPLINRLLAQGKQVFLPRVPARGKRRLWFAALEANQPFTVNRFGIAEPVSACPVRAHRLDVLFMPLLGFDAGGNRIGMGGGFYDATLAAVRPSQRPLCIGVAYACQQVDEAPVEAWDQPLAAVLTESFLLSLNRLR